jgi:hypothetical protein
MDFIMDNLIFTETIYVYARNITCYSLEYRSGDF